MNAADQRRLTPFLAAACVLAGAIVVIMLSGVGSSVRWSTAKHTQSATTRATGNDVLHVQSKPLDAYAVVWQRPLFNAQRQPVPSSGNDDGKRVSLGDLELTGIILTPGLHMALMHDRKADHDIRVREGAAVPDGNWVLHALKPRQAVFVDGGKRTTLELKVKGGHGGGPGQPAHAGPSMNTGTMRRVPEHGHPAGSHSRLTMRPSRPSPTSSAADKAKAQHNKARMEAIKARIKQIRRQQRERRDKDGDGS